jgi:hypothetical protein
MRRIGEAKNTRARAGGSRTKNFGGFKRLD